MPSYVVYKQINQTLKKTENYDDGKNSKKYNKMILS